MSAIIIRHKETCLLGLCDCQHVRSRFNLRGIYNSLRKIEFVKFTNYTHSLWTMNKVCDNEHQHFLLHFYKDVYKRLSERTDYNSRMSFQSGQIHDIAVLTQIYPLLSISSCNTSSCSTYPAHNSREQNYLNNSVNVRLVWK